MSFVHGYLRWFYEEAFESRAVGVNAGLGG